MLHHLWKLTWKRKSRNLMLSLEILVAFTIVFALTAAGLRYWQLYRMPLGFVAQDVWSVELRTNGVAAGPHYVAAFQNAVRTLPAVQDVAIASFGPYSGSSMLDQAKGPGGIRATNDMIEAGANFAGVLGLDVVAGHWPGAGDDAHAVAIDRAMAAALFPGTNALGRTFTQNDEVQPVRVVGIVDAYRSTGELATPMPVVFRRFTDGGMINWPVFIGAAGLSMAMIYLLSCACALYPGWRASRHSPTQALHDE